MDILELTDDEKKLIVEKRKKDAENAMSVEEKHIQRLITDTEKVAFNYVEDWKKQNEAALKVELIPEFAIVIVDRSKIFEASETIYSPEIDDDGNKLDTFQSGRLIYKYISVEAKEIRFEKKDTEIQVVLEKHVIYHGGFSSSIASKNYELHLYNAYNMFDYKERDRWFKKLSSINKMIDKKLEQTRLKIEAKEKQKSLSERAMKLIKEMCSGSIEIKHEDDYHHNFHSPSCGYSTNHITIRFKNGLKVWFSYSDIPNKGISITIYKLEGLSNFVAFDIVDILSTMSKKER